ncbi:hypothetical protein ATCC90586_006534 [Pythium insidiosum]|nr:hypothetical protein ATCC90586_006534 [Pythium insidiosum]
MVTTTTTTSSMIRPERSTLHVTPLAPCSNNVATPEQDAQLRLRDCDLPFFSVGSMQQQWMMRILFVHAKLHPELGYMQGMNEILAPILYVYGSDTNDEWAREAEADAFHSFQTVMGAAKLLYSRSPSDPSKTGVDMQMTRLAVLLRQHDALLWQHLNSIGLTPEFYSFRWYMTLLAREFPMPVTLRIWDALLADPRRFSFLHYTIIMHDPVQGKDLPHILNDLLCESALGVVSADGETWQWNETSLIEDSSCVSYGSFLRAKYPNCSDMATSKRNKEARKQLRLSFTSPGQPGERLADEHCRLMARLRLPSSQEDDTRLSADQRRAAMAAAQLDGSEYCFIIPAFFRVVQHLHSTGVSFNLIFRTFGDDLVRIAAEFNLFCENRHPFFAAGPIAMDGSDGGIDRRIHLNSMRHGTFYRSDGDTVLVMGTFRQPPCVSTPFDEFYRGEPNVSLIRGIPAIATHLSTAWRSQQATLAIRDFYPYWFSKQEAASAGKLLVIDESHQDLHAVFFDDNILVDDPHIVDARCARTNEEIPWTKTKELHLLRVEPLDVIADDEYFIARLKQSLERSPTKRLEEQTPLLQNVTLAIQDEDHVLKQPDHHRQGPNEPGQVSLRQELVELLRLAYPVQLTTALEFLPGFSCTVLTGHLDSPLKKEYVDAATLSIMFSNITGYAVGFGLMMALDTLCSQAFGAKRFDKIGVYAQSGLVVIGVCLVPIFLANYFMAPVLLWFGQDPVVSELAQVYSRYNLIGMPFVFLYDILRRVMQAQNVMSPMVAIAVISNVVQIGSGYWLAYHTPMGFEGIPLSRSLGNITLPLMVGVYLQYNRAFRDQWWSGWNLTAALEHIRLFLSLGVPAMLMHAMEWWAFEMISLMAGVLPDAIVAISAHAVNTSVVSMVYMVFLGLSVATNIRVGNHLGANEPARARMTSFVGIGLVGFLGAVLAWGIFWWRHAIAELFVNDTETIAMAGHVIMVWAPFEISEAFNCAIQGIYRGAGKQSQAVRTNAFSYYVVGVPLAYLLALKAGWGVGGLWIGIGIGVSVSFTALWLMMRRWDWHQLAVDAEHRTAE